MAEDLYETLLANYRNAWAGLHMIREAIETLGPRPAGANRLPRARVLAGAGVAMARIAHASQIEMRIRGLSQTGAAEQNFGRE